MKLYVVKNDDGKLWDYDHSCWSNSNGGNYTSGKSYAEDTVDFRGGHVVPLVEKPEPVEVSEEEAEMLESLKDGDLMPIGELSYFIGHAEQLTEKESIKREDRLMRAYVNGWTVKKPKRYVLPMAGTNDGKYKLYAHKSYDRSWNATFINDSTPITNVRYTVTDADLEDAPEWIKAIGKVEVHGVKG